MQDTIKELRDNIKQDKEALEAKMQVLEALEAEEKKNRPFSHTMLGGALFKATRYVTSGIANLHDNLDEQLRSPYQFQAKQLATQAEKLLTKAEKLNREDAEKACTKMAVRLAELVMETEDFLKRHGDFMSELLEENLEKMRTEVERLRPPRNEEQAVSLKEQIERGFDSAPAGVV